MRYLSRILLLPALVAACVTFPPPPVDDDCGCASESGDELSTGDDPTWPSYQTVTTATAGQDTSGVDSGDSVDSGDTATTGEPGEPTLPPKILSLELDPTTVWSNRGIQVSVLAEHTDQVLLQSHLGDVPLMPAGEGVFVGEIPITSGLYNGQHEARVIPFAFELEGDAVTKLYDVDLPDPGSAYYWEVDYATNGIAVAATTLPDQSVLEFRTVETPEGPRCTMIHRGEFGAYGPGDLLEIAPGNYCQAIDIKTAPDGTVYILSKRKAGAFTPWHLLRMVAWGAPLQHIGLGSDGETAVALATHPYENTVAVCGTAATGKADMVDVMAWTFGEDLLPNTWTKDYVPEGKDPNQFSEHVNDCVFTETEVVLVGELYGRHGLEDEMRHRLFFASIDPETGAIAWRVAPPDGQQNSGAHAIATDPSGHLYVGGYACGHPCDAPEGELRIYADYFLERKESLGYFPASDQTVFDVAWSPADYPLVTTLGASGAFTVRALQWFGEPLWTFNRIDLGAIHRAKAMTLGKYGQLYITGIGHTDHPAFAIVAP